jgi:hypothetical protein
VNIRYLGLVRLHCKREAAKNILLTEMVSRSRSFLPGCSDRSLSFRFSVLECASGSFEPGRTRQRGGSLSLAVLFSLPFSLLTSSEPTVLASLCRLRVVHNSKGEHDSDSSFQTAAASLINLGKTKTRGRRETVCKREDRTVRESLKMPCTRTKQPPFRCSLF